MLDDILRLIRWHFASGEAAWFGLLLLFVAGLCSTFYRSRITPKLWQYAGGLGLIFTWLGAPPVSSYLLVLLSAAAITWLMLERLKAAPQTTSYAMWMTQLTTGALAVIWLLGVLPHTPLKPVSKLYIIGDSITSGEVQSERTWPQLLAEQYSVEVIDAAFAGATAATAQTQISAELRACDTLWIEIGGNDVLGPTTANQFAEHLNTLLELAVSPERQTFMMELPLPPTQHDMGAIQRALARKFQVNLTSRREFLSILTTRGNTTDGIHLSEAGHTAMMNAVARRLKLARRPTPEAGHWVRLERLR